MKKKTPKIRGGSFDSGKLLEQRIKEEEEEAAGKERRRHAEQQQWARDILSGGFNPSHSF
jgi:hypothetical protein